METLVAKDWVTSVVLVRAQVEPEPSISLATRMERSKTSAASCLPKENVEKILGLAKRMEELDDISELCALLTR